MVRILTTTKRVEYAAVLMYENPWPWFQMTGSLYMNIMGTEGMQGIGQGIRAARCERFLKLTFVFILSFTRDIHTTPICYRGLWLGNVV